MTGEKKPTAIFAIVVFLVGTHIWVNMKTLHQGHGHLFRLNPAFAIAEGISATNKEGIDPVKQLQKNVRDYYWRRKEDYAKTTSNNSFPTPSDIFNSDDMVQAMLPPPLTGQHNHKAQDVIFCFVRGLSVQYLARFVGSLEDVGFTGDVVFAVAPWNDLDEDTRAFLIYHGHSSGRDNGLNVIAYGVDVQEKHIKGRPMHKVLQMYKNISSQEYLPDPRDFRFMAMLRFEFYWCWSLQYQIDSRIMVTDGRDVFFQSNPFANLPKANAFDRTIFAYVEDAGTPLKKQNSNRLWISKSRGPDVLQEIGDFPVVCSGTTFGGHTAMETYLRAMVTSYDETLCQIYGCDQGHHNYLMRTGRLVKDSLGAVEHVEYFDQGASNALVNTLGVYSLKHRPSIRLHGVVDNTTNLILNFDGSISSVIHQFDRDKEYNEYMEDKAREYLERWRSHASSTHPTMAKGGGSR